MENFLPIVLPELEHCLRQAIPAGDAATLAEVIAADLPLADPQEQLFTEAANLVAHR